MSADRLPDTPPHHQTIMPYLIIEGADRFIIFMRDVFGATEIYREHRDQQTAQIMHAEITVGGSTLMLADATEQYPRQTAGLFIYTADADAAYTRAIEAGATGIMPPADMPYGRSCGITDPFGNTWWPTTPLKS